MKFLLHLVVSVIALWQLSCGVESKMVCYHDATSSAREGPLKFTPNDMEQALQFCTHVIYGHASITPKTCEVTTLLPQREKEFSQIQQLKKKYPNVKFLLSISGEKNSQSTENVLELLEADHQAQQTFVASAVQILHKYKFHGLSLDFQLPTENPIKLLSYYEKVWDNVVNFFTGNSIVDPKTKEHKSQITDLILQLSASLKKDNLMLALTVLPNVNSKWYFNAPAIIPQLDFVILAAFDFYTPERNPEVADYMAPIKAHIDRFPQATIDFQVQQWLSQKIPSRKIVLGVATWGRSWKMSNESSFTGIPPVFYTKGPSEAEPQTQTPGFISWPEICKKLPSPLNKFKSGAEAPLRRIVDPTNKYGNYAYRPADHNGDYGIWISYEEPSTAAIKTEYAKKHNLGGMALFDLSLDDVRGQCNGDKFPILRSIQFKLLQ